MGTALAIGVAGFFGSVARYLVQGFVGRASEVFPWGTLVVNVTGSFVLGLAVGALSHRVAVHPDLRVAVTVGFLGAYTTFSTLTFETHELVRSGAGAAAAGNIVLSIAGGLLAVWAGMSLGRVI